MQRLSSSLARATCRLPGVLAFVCCLAALAFPARADDSDTAPGGTNPLARINWTKGPAKVKLGDVAALDLPAGYRFADGDGTRTLQELNQNPSSGKEIGAILPEDGSWFLIFSYDPVGHVNDDEKDSLNEENANKMLESIRSGTERANQVRAGRGWPPLHIVGWNQSPFYDSQTQHMTWAIRVSSTGPDQKESESINYNSRLLGRGGVISANMIIDPPSLDATVPTYRTLVEKVSFSSGNRYDEFRTGDKIAHYGLIGLVTGGAAVAVVKGWKFFAKIGAAAVAGIAALFRSIKSKFTRKTSAAR